MNSHQSTSRRATKWVAAGATTALVAAGLLAGSSPALADDHGPGGTVPDVLPLAACSESGYLVQTASSRWDEIDLVSGTFSTDNDTLNDPINAIGYNVNDNRIWGYTPHDSGPTPRDSYLTVTGLNNTGDLVTDRVGPIAGLPYTNYNVGDVDANGYLWLVRGDTSVGRPKTGYVVDLSNQQLIGHFQVTFPASVVDWAFGTDGNIYAVAKTGPTAVDGQLVRITPNFANIGDPVVSMPVTNLGDAGLLATTQTTIDQDQFGAAYFDSNGYLYVGANRSGEIFRIDTNGLTTATDYDETQTVLFSTANASSTNDGARCLNSPVSADYGDAPDTYQTSLSTNGPAHALAGYDETSNTATVQLGAAIDRENDGVPGLGTGDNTAGIDDEDGVATWPTLITSDSSYSIDVTASNAAADDATLAGWIDFDGNGTFDADEVATATVPAGSAGATIALTWASIPSDATAGDFYARLRVSTDLPEISAGVLNPGNGAPNGEVEDYPITLDAPAPAISLVKTADVAEYDEVGDTINYTLTATNTGNVALTDVTVSDALAGLSALTCTPNAGADLAPNATMECAASYSVTQADLDAGTVTNDASVTGNPPTGDPVTDAADVSVAGLQTPAIGLVKTADTELFDEVGDEIGYTLVATNTGNVTLTEVEISDELEGLSDVECVDFTDATLSPEESITCTATYAVTAADLAAGNVFNEATVYGNPPLGVTRDRSDDLTATDDVTVAGQAPSTNTGEETTTPVQEKREGNTLSQTGGASTGAAGLIALSLLALAGIALTRRFSTR